MRSIRAIFRGDLRRVTASIVSIVILLGLCVVPCLYACLIFFPTGIPMAPTPPPVSPWRWCPRTRVEASWAWK